MAIPRRSGYPAQRYAVMLSPLALDILQHGLDDFIQLSEVTGVAEHYFGVARVAVKRTVMELLHELICDQLMTPGDLHDSGFVPWDVSPSAALERIEAEWTALDHDPGLGDIVWLANTPRGNEIATRSLDQ